MIVSLFVGVMTSVNNMVPPSTEIPAVYENSSDDDQEFVQNLALFLTSFLTSHVKVCMEDADICSQIIDPLTC